MNGAQAVVAVIKAAFTFSPEGTTRISSEQLPLFFGDQYRNEPGKSSVRYPSDMVCEKMGTDIAVNGHAYTPGFVPARESSATLRVGSFSASIVVRGDRTFTSRLGFVSKTEPLPFVRMPLLYERAFGGTDTNHPDPSRHGVFKENPVGKGFRVKQTQAPVKGHPLPNIEDVENPVNSWTDRPKPAGFGCIPPFWEPRLSYMGTFDDSWRENRMPLSPVDADIRYNNAAHPGLVTPLPLTGKETVTLVHLHPEREKVTFALPDLRLTTAFTFEHETVKPRPVLDTLIIEPDDNRFILVYRSFYSGPMPTALIRQVAIYEDTKETL